MAMIGVDALRVAKASQRKALQRQRMDKRRWAKQRHGIDTRREGKEMLINAKERRSNARAWRGLALIGDGKVLRRTALEQKSNECGASQWHR
jgi:hypothetical protein